MFRKMPFILAVVILATALLSPLMPILCKQILYSVSLSIKELIIIILPVLIFCMLFKAAVMLANSATKIILCILVLVCISNFASLFIASFVGHYVHSFNLSLIAPATEHISLGTLWKFSPHKLIANDKAMFAGLILGITIFKTRSDFAMYLASKFDVVVKKLMKLFIYLIPPFIAGFIVKMQHDQVIGVIVRDYILIFMCVAIAEFSYITLAYFLLNKCKILSTIQNIKIMLPAAISGFSTMSSAATMPLTIIGAESICKNKDIARASVVATVNVHLVGAAFGLVIFTYAVSKSFGVPEPSLLQYIIFAFYIVLSKFSAAGIPGGGIMVTLPIVESYLGFNSEMLSLLTALCILFDPISTCANVYGNGAFAKLVDRCLNLRARLPKSASR